MIQDAGALSSRITLRPVAVADDAFLYSVYASTRAEEMTRVPWTPEQKEAFLRMQFTAQKQHYAAEFPHAQRWFDAINARPAVQRALQVLSDVNSAAPHDEKSRDILFGKTQFQRR